MKEYVVKIAKIKVYQIDLPLKEGRYNLSNGNCSKAFDNTVMEVFTDEDVIRYAYLPSFAFRVRAGLAELTLYLIHLTTADHLGFDITLIFGMLEASSQHNLKEKKCEAVK